MKPGFDGASRRAADKKFSQKMTIKYAPAGALGKTKKPSYPAGSSGAIGVAGETVLLKYEPPDMILKK